MMPKNNVFGFFICNLAYNLVRLHLFNGESVKKAYPKNDFTSLRIPWLAATDP